MRPPSLLLAVTLGVTSAGAAHADAPAASRWVGAAILPERRVDVSVVHELRLSRFRYWPDEVGLAWADGIDVAVGVSPRLTLGISHSARSRGTVDHGGGLCHELRGHPCDAAYAGALVDARGLVSSTRRSQLAALARLGVMGLAPTRPVTRLGLSVRHWRGPLWGAVEPEVQVALGNRAYGSRDQLVVPLWIGVGRRRAAAWVMSGVRGEIVGFTEKLEIPFMLGAGVTIGGARVGAEAGWPQLAGPQNTGNVRHAAVWLGGTY